MKTSILSSAVARRLPSLVAAMFAATTAVADGNNGSKFSGVGGNFGGSVGSFSQSGGVSVTGGMGGSGRSFTRNESGSGQFSGASVNWDSNVSKGGGDVTMGAETFTDGFDFSKTINRNGGAGFAGAKRGGAASAGGSFGGGFSNFKGGFGGSNWDNDDD